MSKEDYQTRMRRRQTGTTVKVPTPQPVENVEPIEAYPEGNTVSIHDLAAITKGGSEVQMPRSREMTAEERKALEKGESPSVRLTRLERETLVKCGWEEGDPVPADFSKAVQDVFTQYLEKEQAKGIPIENIKITDIEDLPPEEQARLRASMREAIDAVRGGDGDDILTGKDPQPVKTEKQVAHEAFRDAYPDSIAKALEVVDEATVQTTPNKPAPAAKPVETIKTLSNSKVDSVICRTCGSDAFKPKERLTCPHCGSNAVDNPDDVEISTDDKSRFLLSLGTRQPFCKRYTLFGDTIEVWVRSLSRRELDSIQLWSLKVAAKELREMGTGGPVTQSDVFARAYFKELFITTLFQVKSVSSNIEGADLAWYDPGVPYPTLKDWKEAYEFETIDDIADAYSHAIGSESLILAIQDVVALFNRLNYRLSSEAANVQNFWKGI